MESSKREVKLKEDDILRGARVVLPAANFAISKARDLFSGEQSMTLKVAPMLLLESEYGHIVTFKRLYALGFFIGFTVPKLYSLYSIQIHKKASENVFNGILTGLPKPGGGEFGKYYSLPALNDPRVDKLPYSIRILLESAIRNCDNFQVTKEDVEKIIDWEKTSPKQVEIPFKPAHVLLQDFTGVPAVVDLACMRDAMNNLGGDSDKINPLVPVDLVIDHSVQVVKANMELLRI